MLSPTIARMLLATSCLAPANARDFTISGDEFDNIGDDDLGDDDLGDDLSDLDDEDEDEVGDDDLGDDDLGDDEDDDPLTFLGADKKKKPKKPKVVRAGSSQPTHQIQVLPFPLAQGGAVSVPASATHTVSARPQRDKFQVQRFTWASTTSQYFLINQLTVGVDNMFAQAGQVPAEIFSQVGVGVSLRGFIAKPGIDVTLQVTNIDTVNAHPIYAAIMGAVLL
jgi:hypothetical protein